MHHSEFMGVIVRFPVQTRVASARRIGRIFEPQEQLEAARLAGMRFFSMAFALTGLVAGVLQLAAP